MAERGRCLQCGRDWSPYRASLRLKVNGRYGPQLCGFNLCETCALVILDKLGLCLADDHPMRKIDMEPFLEPPLPRLAYG